MQISHCLNRIWRASDNGKSRCFGAPAAMSGPSACLSPSSRFLWRACRFGWCLGLSLVFGLGLAAQPAGAAGSGVDCLSGGKASPAELMAACSAIVDDASTSRADLAAALVARADARARTSGGLSQALADLDRAIGFDGSNARAYRLRGDLTRAAGGSRAKAEANLTRAIALDPRDAEAFEQRGIVYTNQHRFDRAIADYDTAIRLKPDYAQAWSDRGATYYLGGDYDKAVRDSDEALRLDPDRPRTYANRASAYKKLGRLDKSLADDNEAVQRDSSEPEYFDNRGLTYAAMKQYDKAIADYDQAIALQQRADFFTNRGDSYQFKGELGTALSDYDTALRLDPNFALAHNNRAVLFNKMGERAKALADYEATLRLDPGNENAIEGRRAMKAEVARFGAQTPAPLHAPGAHPSFDCGTVRLAVEKAICADPELGALDHQVADTYTRLLNASAGRSADILRRAQRDFIARRNAGFGKPDYDLEKAMKERLDKLLAVERK
jgi:tetratricopeptide (TPR) repeat protein